MTSCVTCTYALYVSNTSSQCIYIPSLNIVQFRIRMERNKKDIPSKLCFISLSICIVEIYFAKEALRLKQLLV